MIFLINMVKSKIFYSFKFFYIRKQIQLYIIEFMKENGEINIEIRTFTAFFLQIVKIELIFFSYLELKLYWNSTYFVFLFVVRYKKPFFA